MILHVLEAVIVCVGFALTAVLFYRLPRVAKRLMPTAQNSLSVIIPARNEEANLALLLADLQDQSVQALEIICVDDDSTDATAQIARAFGVQLISLKDKPDGWMGKSWACHQGAARAKGDTLLFLDADVRLGKDALSRLIATHQTRNHPISVQPYHRTQRGYEQSSILFNLLQIGANGTALPEPINVGLYGPIIVLSQGHYHQIGGHARVRTSIVEDMALAERMRQEHVPFSLYVGDEEIAFQMYPAGLKSLLQGWTKNLAAGVAKTPKKLFFMVFLWIASMLSVPVHLVGFALAQNDLWVLFYALFYVLWVMVLFHLTKQIGGYLKWPILLYPFLLFVYFAVLSVALYKKLFGLSVVWKGRAIKGED